MLNGILFRDAITEISLIARLLSRYHFDSNGLYVCNIISYNGNKEQVRCQLEGRKNYIVSSFDNGYMDQY